VTFADGDAAKYDAVVWATGFTTDHTWIDIPGVTGKQGRILHTRGVTPSPGLYMHRPHVAAHQNLGAAWLGAERRGLPRRADRGPHR